VQLHIGPRRAMCTHLGFCSPKCLPRSRFPQAFGAKPISDQDCRGRATVNAHFNKSCRSDDRYSMLVVRSERTAVVPRNPEGHDAHCGIFCRNLPP
jgi:hypothetical protein